MIRGDRPISKKQAIQFCEERQTFHKLKADKLFKTLNIEDDVEVAKHNAIIDLSNIYGDIAEMLKGHA